MPEKQPLVRANTAEKHSRETQPRNTAKKHSNNAFNTADGLPNMSFETAIVIDQAAEMLFETFRASLRKSICQKAQPRQGGGSIDAPPQRMRRSFEAVSARYQAAEWLFQAILAVNEPRRPSTTIAEVVGVLA